MEKVEEGAGSGHLSVEAAEADLAAVRRGRLRQYAVLLHDIVIYHNKKWFGQADVPTVALPASGLKEHLVTRAARRRLAVNCKIDTPAEQRFRIAAAALLALGILMASVYDASAGMGKLEIRLPAASRRPVRQPTVVEIIKGPSGYRVVSPGVSDPGVLRPPGMTGLREPPAPSRVTLPKDEWLTYSRAQTALVDVLKTSDSLVHPIFKDFENEDLQNFRKVFALRYKQQQLENHHKITDRFSMHEATYTEILISRVGDVWELSSDIYSAPKGGGTQQLVLSFYLKVRDVAEALRDYLVQKLDGFLARADGVILDADHRAELRKELQKEFGDLPDGFQAVLRGESIDVEVKLQVLIEPSAS